MTPRSPRRRKNAVKVAYFIVWAVLTLWEGRRLRELREKQDAAIFWGLSFAALALGIAFACLPDGTGLAEWLQNAL